MSSLMASNILALVALLLLFAGACMGGHWAGSGGYKTRVSQWFPAVWFVAFICLFTADAIHR